MDPRTLVNLLQREFSPQVRGSGRIGSVAWATTRGLVRTENQDRLLIAQAASGLNIAIVADGMGGMKEGAYAASIAASMAAFICMKSRTFHIDQLLRDALDFSNQEVFSQLRGSGGAAVVMMAWNGHERYIAHAGDARAYLVNEDGKLLQLTVDDTVRGQLDYMGRASAGESSLHAQLLQFIGMGKDLEPHITKIPPGGRGVILTSDGVHCLPVSVMEWAVRTSGYLQQAAERLIAASEWNGGSDNGTTIVVGPQTTGTSTPYAVEFWTLGEHLIFSQDSPVSETTTRVWEHHRPSELQSEELETPTVQPASLNPRLQPSARMLEDQILPSGKGRKQKRRSKPNTNPTDNLESSNDSHLPIVTFEAEDFTAFPNQEDIRKQPGGKGNKP